MLFIYHQKRLFCRKKVDDVLPSPKHTFTYIILLSICMWYIVHIYVHAITHIQVQGNEIQFDI